MKLTFLEWTNLILAVVKSLGEDTVTGVMRRALGEERADLLIRDRKGPRLSKDDNRAIVRELYAVAPGQTREDKISWAIAIAQPAFDSRERFLEVIRFVRERVEADEAAGGTLENPPPRPVARTVALADAIVGALDGNRIPNITYMEFTFADGSKLAFRQFNAGDYWGGVPAVGFGQVTDPDGTTRNMDINTLIRKGQRAYPYPGQIPDLDWGRLIRYSIVGKTLYRRADGLPLECAVAVDLNKAAVRITAGLVSATARVEAWMA